MFNCSSDIFGVIGVNPLSLILGVYVHANLKIIGAMNKQLWLFLALGKRSSISLEVLSKNSVSGSK